MGRLIDRPREVKPARMEWSAMSAPLLTATEESVERATPSWSIVVGPSVALRIGLIEPGQDRRDPYLLTSNLSRRDAEVFLNVFGPMIEHKMYHKSACVDTFGKPVSDG